MPKEKRDRSASFNRSRVPPYTCSSSRAKSSPKKPLGALEDVREWEDARCPVCMEHPHNAVLLKCSSHGNGCRPYMCDTSRRHSNCLDLFRKSSLDENQKLSCPLCRGRIHGWDAAGPARDLMNVKMRSCARENCSFSGTYADLRKHARHEHPLVRPSVADPERERDWRRLEQQRDLGDLLSTLQSSLREEELVGDLDVDHGGLLTVFFLIRVFRPRFGTRGSRTRPASRNRTTRLWGESYDVEMGSSAVDEESQSRDVAGLASGPLRRRPWVRRRSTPENED